ncbi:DUF6479 family protein [Streptomyces scopuliridis]|uniref:DUF6479 family protein n=1 Tax=Streptomyces scopuliridis TaxID=452529 RepID=UPI0036B9A079
MRWYGSLTCGYASRMEALRWQLSASPVSAMPMLLVGVVAAAVLVAPFVWGRRIRARELPPPRPEEQPHLPADGPVPRRVGLGRHHRRRGRSFGICRCRHEVPRLEGRAG